MKEIKTIDERTKLKEEIQKQFTYPICLKESKIIIYDYNIYLERIERKIIDLNFKFIVDLQKYKINVALEYYGQKFITVTKKVENTYRRLTIENQDINKKRDNLKIYQEFLAEVIVSLKDIFYRGKLIQSKESIKIIDEAKQIIDKIESDYVIKSIVGLVTGELPIIQNIDKVYNAVENFYTIFKELPLDSYILLQLNQGKQPSQKNKELKRACKEVKNVLSEFCKEFSVKETCSTKKWNAYVNSQATLKFLESIGVYYCMEPEIFQSVRFKQNRLKQIKKEILCTCIDSFYHKES